jgi:hypothetical protein
MTDHQAPGTSTLDVLLLESGQPESPELKSVLLELQALGSGPAPAPSARLQALLESPRTATGLAVASRAAASSHLANNPASNRTAPNSTAQDDSALDDSSTLPEPIPLRRRRRGAIVSLSVVAAMGLGVGAAAAASGDFRGAAEQVISGIVQTVLPHSGTSPTDRKAVPAPNTAHTPPAPSSDPTSSEPGQPAAGKESAPPTPVPSAGPGNGTGGSRASIAPSSAKPAAPQLPALPEQAAHGLPTWLVPGIPPAVPPAVGQVGKDLHVPVPQDPGGSPVPLPTTPAMPGQK